MKIVIFSTVSDLRSHKNIWNDTTFLSVSCLDTIESLIKENQEEDIEGFILPNAIHNPELPAILKAIYQHKKHLYYFGPKEYDTPPQLDFEHKIFQAYGIKIS